MQCVRRLRLRPVLQYRRMGADVSSGALDAPLTTRSGTRKRGALSRCDAEGSVLFVCDLQERFQSIIHEFETVTKTARMLIEAARALKIPIVVTEQYPERLGPTVQELSDALSHPAPDEDIKIIPKTRFSMMVEDNNYPSEDRQTVILCGIEAHVCVLQTALDLLFDGHTVFIVKDGVSSSRQNDRVTAINRLENAGAVITTAESVLFDMMRDAKHPNFREVSKMVKTRAKEPNAFADDS
uniref:Isochorismatase-like domain-containing protein n=1 Tax=Pinguiococcus pyrenoidosus TaxID=172671 RepID=A0A7R9U9A9_9STRA|mmetsp:Transcript_2031/g.8962  ORF Transcript_2031/g.8962 Transcript_2031/m.8962 type:complete len:240 (+) Transcript_2031:6-725(+)